MKYHQAFIWDKETYRELIGEEAWKMLLSNNYICKCGKVAPWGEVHVCSRQDGHWVTYLNITDLEENIPSFLTRQRSYDGTLGKIFSGLRKLLFKIEKRIMEKKK